MTAPRLEQIREAVDNLESVFADPACFRSSGSIDSRPVQDYAESLASEFIGRHADDEIVGRLRQLIKAEDAGHPKDARRHLTFIRRKLTRRLVEWEGSDAAKPLVAEGRDSAGAAPGTSRYIRPQTPKSEVLAEVAS